MKDNGTLELKRPVLPLPEALAFIESAFVRNTKDCILWPSGSPKYYPVLTIEGRNIGAHRYVCTKRFGPAPKKAEAAHSCNNRSCINPNHLRWASRKQNEEDKIAHGTLLKGDKCPWSKTSPEMAYRIKYLETGRECEISRRLGVSYQVINGIRSGRTWKHI